MSEKAVPMHFVCTLEEAEAVIGARNEFWVSNCGCREGKGGCSRSRMDLCLMFADIPSSGSGKRRIDRTAVDMILREARQRRLVPRPFRDESRRGVDGVCFCCDDCCAYFLNRDEVCDKGRFVQDTDFTACTHCEACVDVCHFEARSMVDDRLTVNDERCHGCGLCRDVCPEDAVRMEPRT